MKTIVTILAFSLLLAGAAAADETTISGFVDASWFLDANSEHHTFGLDQAEVDVERRVGEDLVLRADLEWVKDGDGWAQDAEQGFLAWSPASLGGATLTFGKFNAPIGFELLDAPDMYQYSHSLLFDHALPTNLTGVMYARPVGESFDLCAYWVNGWDVNEAAGDGPETYGGRLGYSLGEKGVVGLSAIRGTEMLPVTLTTKAVDTAPLDRTVFDVDLTLTPADGWLIGGELNLGKVEAEDGASADWTGFMLMANRTLTDRMALTLRFDRLDDPDGAVFGQGEDVRSSLTISPSWVLDDGLTALFELRQDMSDQELWFDADGQPTDTALTAALEVTAVF
ncbi:MAG TPA: outer membrane beta-barrel protein [Candidatus Krumholzibacteria bacterium]|nr:outer membrane beta-barrel protein [Candidatus Krumholzibacteria bacterium]HRX51264.1 outer membrane beta-barrel protein [Candidatus Krumholzibacteria bacterium]